jgi:hypothetical protein
LGGTLVFRGIDTFGTTSDVHLLLNNSVVASDRDWFWVAQR